MKYLRESFIPLACAALVTACSGPETGPDAPASDEAEEQGEVSVPSEETSAGSVIEEHSDEDHDHEEDHEDEDHAHTDADGARLESHVHGEGMLAVTVQGNMLDVLFDAPLTSLGAPENPQSEEDEAQIEAVTEAVRNDEDLITLEGDAGCEVVSISSGTRIVSGHGELQLAYYFDCENIDALEGVRFGGFEQYPALEHIDAVFVSDTQQSAAELSAGAPILEIN